MTSPHWHKTPCGLTRARGLGIAFDGEPGPFNAITDVEGVAVGYKTLIRGEGKLVAGKGPVRTGVTAILARGLKGAGVPCAAGSFAFNGNGEMTGLAWIEESGELQTPITITNTHSCGVTRDATIAWMVARGIAASQNFSLPVAAETYDGFINDINGFHVSVESTFEALDGAASGPIEMGSVGGGTGMMTYEFKGGSASASRRVAVAGGRYVVGAFVQSNFGRRRELTVRGVPVGRTLTGGEFLSQGTGSIIAVIATDAPLMAHQLKRLARRVPLGLARTGTIGHNGSGDIFLAVSTANEKAFAAPHGRPRHLAALANDDMDPLFAAVVETIEEAVIDAMVANRAMTGINGFTVHALPHDALLAALRQAGRG
jgi:L-aminopeptidase/D-esterase-like protein